MAIQNDNTVLNKGDLKAYHEKILPYLGGNMMMQTGVSDYYSTEEKVVGVWIDGKPLYQKTVHTGPFSVEASSSVAGRGWQRLTAVPANLENLVLARFININGTEYKTQQAFAFTMGTTDPGYISVVNFRDVNLAADDAILFLQYTKTTDTASSALTTPGCYDINRPDLWPVNKEIFFGNGLYGYRKTGTVTAASDERNMITIATNPGGTIGIVNSGGWIKWGDEGPSNDYKYSINTTLTNLPGWGNHLGAWSTIRTVNSSISLWNASGLVRTNAPYDIWVTYTK